jgi:hypothetical protein
MEADLKFATLFARTDVYIILAAPNAPHGGPAAIFSHYPEAASDIILLDLHLRHRYQNPRGAFSS